MQCIKVKMEKQKEKKVKSKKMVESSRRIASVGDRT
jgi:hypothetical protein